MECINIFGDSFGASVHSDSWVSLLGKEYSIKNYCINGASEYRILQSIKDNTPNEGVVILVHTNPYRIFVEYNPLHQGSTHNNCDIVASDIVYHKNTAFGNAAMKYFKFLFSEKMQDDFYDMCVLEENRLLSKCKVIHTTHFNTNRDMIHFDYTNSKNKGNINHYDKKGNWLVYNQLRNEIIKPSSGQ